MSELRALSDRSGSAIQLICGSGSRVNLRAQTVNFAPVFPRHFTSLWIVQLRQICSRLELARLPMNFQSAQSPSHAQREFIVKIAQFALLLAPFFISAGKVRKPVGMISIRCSEPVQFLVEPCLRRGRRTVPVPNRIPERRELLSTR